MMRSLTLTKSFVGQRTIVRQAGETLWAKNPQLLPAEPALAKQQSSQANEKRNKLAEKARKDVYASVDRRRHGLSETCLKTCTYKSSSASSASELDYMTSPWRDPFTARVFIATYGLAGCIYSV